MDDKITRKIEPKTIDHGFVEEWNKRHPKIGIEEAKVPVMKAGQLSCYSNYRLRDLLMELLQFLRDPLHVVVIRDFRDYDHFKELEKTAISVLTEMVGLLSTKW